MTGDEVAARPRRSAPALAAAWIAVGVAAVALGAYAVALGPDLLDAWGAEEPDAGLVRFLLSGLLVVVLVYAGLLVLLARLVRGPGRDAQSVGAWCLVVLGCCTLFVAFLLRGGALSGDDTVRLLPLVAGLLLVAGGAVAAVDVHRRPAAAEPGPTGG